MKTFLSLRKTQGLFSLFFLFAFLLFAQRSVAQTPTITSFSPLSADIGAPVTITGTNFDATAANNIVFFGATRATVSAASTATSLIVTVPVGATHAAITVLNATTSKIGYSSAFFRPKPSSQKSGFTETDLEPSVELTGTVPGFVAIGDINGDGLSDIVATNSSSNTVSVFRNTSTTGSVSFASKVDFGTGDGPRHVSIGDIDGDGLLDLAVTNGTSSTISLFRNTSSSGTVSFAAKEDIVTGATTLETVIGDLDGDGQNDLASIVPANSITLFRNIGSPGSFNFAAGTSYGVGGSNGASISIGDLNEDGLPDLAVGKTSGGVSVFQNTSTLGTISFDTPQTFAAIGFVRSVSMADIDGDGLLDLSVLGQVAVNVFILRNTSSGTISFASPTNVSVSSGSSPQGQSVTTGDMDGDGKLDIIVGRATGLNLTVARNTSTSGNITFDAQVHFTTGSAGMQRAAVGDFDGDGLPDIALSRTANAAVSVFRNGPALTVSSGTLAAVNTTYGTASGTTTFTVAGIGIASGITVTPPAGFELSQTAGGASGFAGAGTAITVTGTGTIAATTIYMRLASSITLGSYSGNIVFTAGSTTQTIASIVSTVSAATLTITANNANRNYGAAALSGGAGSTAFTTTGLQNSETIGSVTITYTAGVGNGNTLMDGAATYIGSVVPSLAAGGTFTPANYIINYTPGNLIVNKVALIITAADKTRIFGASDPVFTANYSGFLNGDTEAGLSKPPVFSTTATVSSAAGNYSISPLGAISANYTPSYVNGTLTILPYVNQAPTLASIANQVICYTPALQSITLSGITPGPESSQTTTLSVSGNNSSLFSNLSIAGGNGSSTGALSFNLNPGVSGTVVITVTVKDDGGTADGGMDTFSRAFTVTINPAVEASISSSTGATLSKGLTATLTASGGTIYQWSNADGIISAQNTSILTIRPLITTTYTVAVSNSSGCTITQSITITVNDDYKSLDALNAITPNGDGKNDTWTIRNIDAYPNNMVKVFDRAGRLVYSKKGYTNDWDGSYNGLPLQQGTYYFVVELGLGSSPMKGFISIVRQ